MHFTFYQASTSEAPKSRQRQAKGTTQRAKCGCGYNRKEPCGDRMVLYLDCLKGSIMLLALTLQFCKKTIVWKNSGWERWENWEMGTQ